MQAKEPTLIQGNKHTDERGVVGFVNAFDMKDVRRFYRIRNHNTHLK